MLNVNEARNKIDCLNPWNITVADLREQRDRLERIEIAEMTAEQCEEWARINSALCNYGYMRAQAKQQEKK